MLEIVNNDETPKSGKAVVETNPIWVKGLRSPNKLIHTLIRNYKIDSLNLRTTLAKDPYTGERRLQVSQGQGKKITQTG